MPKRIVASRQKSGRRASDEQRKKAQDLVAIYRLAAASPDGRYCANPEDDWEERKYLDYSDPSLLLSALTCFANYGTFSDPFADSVNDLLVRDHFEKLRAAGLTYQDAVVTLAEQYASTESTIKRRVRQAQIVTPNGSD